MYMNKLESPTCLEISCFVLGLHAAAYNGLLAD